MNDELSEFGGAPVGVAAVPKEELREVAELRDGEIGGEGGLFAFLSYNTDA